MPCLRVMLLGSSDPGKTSLTEQLRSWDQHIQIFTSEAVVPLWQDGLTFLLVPDSSHANDAHAERLLRTDLDRHNIHYQVLYGTTDEWLTQALQVIQSKLADRTTSLDSKREEPQDQPGAANPSWVSTCDKCSDPACEHQLLTGLLARRNGRTTELLP